MNGTQPPPHPVEPAPTPWVFPDPEGPDEVVAVGGDLMPGTILAAYRRGLFPMHVPDGRLGWWFPERRGVLPLDRLVVSRSLRRSLRRYRVSTDEAFDAVVAACGDEGKRPDTWITDEFRTGYGALHRLGWAHSVEVWDDDGRLVGGLYGLAIGGGFFGESMFHEATDASKVALVRLVEHMVEYGGVLLDVQWLTPHLARLGAVEVSRGAYLELLAEALALPPFWGLAPRSPAAVRFPDRGP